MYAYPCKRLASFLVTASLLAGCGSGTNSTPVSTTPTYPDITGNWALSAASQVSSVTYVMGGFITNTSGAVTGTIHIVNSVSCFNIAETIFITGSVTTSGTLTATSAVVNSQVITINGTLTNTALTGGTFSVAGGCDNGDHGTITGYAAPSYTNTYAGSFISTPTRLVIATTIVSAQSGPDSSGLYHITGPVAFSGSPCFTSGTIPSLPLADSTIAGSYVSITINTTNGTVFFTGYLTDSTGKTISGNYSVSGGTCNGDYGTGTVSHS